MTYSGSPPGKVDSSVALEFGNNGICSDWVNKGSMLWTTVGKATMKVFIASVTVLWSQLNLLRNSPKNETKQISWYTDESPGFKKLYNRNKESHETLQDSLEVICILNARPAIHLKTSGAAHLFCSSSRYCKSREGQSVPCGSCTLWFWPSLLGLEVGSARQHLCAVPSARQGHAFLPLLGHSAHSEPAACRPPGRADWLGGRTGHLQHQSPQGPPGSRAGQLGSPPLLHREGRKLTQIYAFNQKEINGKETKWQHILLSVHLEKKLICSTCVRGWEAKFFQTELWQLCVQVQSWLGYCYSVIVSEVQVTAREASSQN